MKMPTSQVSAIILKGVLLFSRIGLNGVPLLDAEEKGLVNASIHLLRQWHKYFFPYVKQRSQGHA